MPALRSLTYNAAADRAVLGPNVAMLRTVRSYLALPVLVLGMPLGCTADIEPANTSMEATSEDSGSTGPASLDLCAIKGAPTVEIGHGERMFQPLDTGDVEFVVGTQGAYHSFFGLRASNLDHSQVAEIDLVARVDGIRMGSVAEFVSMVCTPDGLEVINMLLVWEPVDPTTQLPADPADLSPLRGKTANLQLLVTDAAGTEIRAEANVVLGTN